MKAIKKLALTAAVCAAAAFLASCANGDEDDTSFTSSSDTVLTLSAPSVSGSAYYGVNYISWAPVQGAYGYSLIRYADGSDDSSATTILLDGYSASVSKTATVYSYADIASSTNPLVDGQSYTYMVQALSTSDPSARTVYVRNSQASVTVTASVPSKDVLEYDTSYTAKFSATNAVKNVTATPKETTCALPSPQKHI